jgi:hypothetical protein
MAFHPPMSQNKIQAAYSQHVRKLTLDVLRAVIDKTPVDTGHARGNWFPSFGKEDFGESDGNSPNYLPSLDTASIARFEPVFIQNNAPYISALEYGHSQRQAPQGMVRVTVAEFK